MQVKFKTSEAIFEGSIECSGGRMVAEGDFILDTSELQISEDPVGWGEAITEAANLSANEKERLVLSVLNTMTDSEREAFILALASTLA